jgi:hypothetical protein
VLSAPSPWGAFRRDDEIKARDVRRGVAVPASGCCGKAGDSSLTDGFSWQNDDATSVTLDRARCGGVLAIPESPDRYDALLDAGVRIYEWQPTELHAKTFVADGEWSAIGSMNFDNRSMALNDESTLMVLDRGLGAQMIGLFL